MLMERLKHGPLEEEKEALLAKLEENGGSEETEEQLEIVNLYLSAFDTALDDGE